jgi:creatinine amidohydrolase
MKGVFILLFIMNILVTFGQGNGTQNLSIKYEELTAPDFIKAVNQSSGVCLLPFGILEKHGAHLPLGTDLLDVRYVATLAAQKEYTVVFPAYYFGQINEARNQPGTVCYSPEVIWKLLQETCDELARNGFKKIIIVNGHGGNTDFLNYFCMSQLHSQKDYVVVVYRPTVNADSNEKIKKLSKTDGGMHAGESETSTMLVSHPDLVKIDLAGAESGVDQKRLSSIPDMYTGIWWYARFPNHYSGDGSKASKELGQAIIDSEVDKLVGLIRNMKASGIIQEIQDQFYKDAANPLNTKQ